MKNKQMLPSLLFHWPIVPERTFPFSSIDENEKLMYWVGQNKLNFCVNVGCNLSQFCKTSTRKEDKTIIWSHGIVVKLQRKPSSFKSENCTNYDTEYGKTSCNGIGNKLPFSFICLSVTLFCLLSEVLVTLPYSRKNLAFISYTRN